MIGRAIASLIGAVFITLVFASPVIAVVSWVAFIISEPKSEGWLVVAFIFTAVAMIVIAYFVAQMRGSKGATSVDLRMASTLPPKKRKDSLTEAGWHPVAAQYLCRDDGIGAMFEIQRSAKTGKTRPYFRFDAGVEVTDDLLEWGRVNVIQFEADYRKQNGHI